VKVQLLVSEWCASCHQAERIWREVAEERDFEFEVLDMGQPEGRELATRLRLRSVPSTVIDGELRAVGVQDRPGALALVAAAPPKAASALRHVGLGMARSARLAVLSSVVYLFLAGAALPVYGGLFAPGTARGAPLHLFTLGFLVFMTYGLGEHMLPRFTGNPIRAGAMVWVQFALAHAGVWALVLGLWFAIVPLTVAGGVCAWSALALFVIRIWPVLWPRGSAAPSDRAGAGADPRQGDGPGIDLG
jgi:glutaredoxin